MDISIIIPCFNLEGYIERCLLSVIKQRLSGVEYEVIIILDSCTDRTEDVARSTFKDSNINLIITDVKVKNAGLARNKGLEFACGEYIYFMDGDDYFVDDYALQKLIDRIRAEGSSAIYMTKFESEDKNIKDRDAIWRFFFKRTSIGDVKFPSYEIDEDWEFVRRVRYSQPYKEGYIDDILYHYTYPRDGGVMTCFRSAKAARALSGNK